MELFVIQCTTCRARLKVHDPAVVGQIIECPKCRSFVAVTAPPDWQSPANSTLPAAISPATTSPAASTSPSTAGGVAARTVSYRPAAAGLKSTASGAAASNIPVARSVAPPPLPKKSGSSMAGISSSSFIKPIQGSVAPPVGRAAAAVGAWAPLANQPAANQPATVPASAASEPAEVATSNPLLASVATALVGRYRWWVVGSAAVIVAVASVAWIIGRSHGTTPPPDQTPVVARAAEPTPGDDIGQEPAPTDPTRNAAPEPMVTQTPAAQQPAATSTASDQTVGVGDSAATEAQAAPASAPALSAEREKLTAGDGVADADPLMPEAYGTAGGKTPETLTGSAGAATEAGSDEGEAFDPIKQARLMAHLQDKLPAFEFTNVPVGQFVAFLAEISTVPMVIDTQSLADAGKSAKTRISVKLDDATVEEALKVALNKPGLAFHIEPGRLIITPRAAKKE